MRAASPGDFLLKINLRLSEQRHLEFMKGWANPLSHCEIVNLLLLFSTCVGVVMLTVPVVAPTGTTAVK
jgi:hypothetical protein